MSSDTDDANDSKRKLLSDTDETSGARTDDADCTDELLEDVDDTEHQASDLNDDGETDDSETEDEQSVHDLLKSIVEGEEIKLIDASKKKKGSSKRRRSERSQQDENVQETTLGNETGGGADAVSSMEDHRKVSKLSLVPLESSAWQHVTSKDPDRPTTAMVLEKKRLAMKLLQKHESSTGKILCGILCILVICGLGAGLTFIGYLFGMTDLYILGGMFGGGGILFAIGFVVVRCMSRDEPADYSVLYRQTVDV